MWPAPTPPPLTLYDLTGGLRIGKRHQRVQRAEVMAHFPTLRTDRLVAGFLYYDARADDARLTMAVARTAALDYGAVMANYAEATGLVLDAAGCVAGARVRAGGVPGDSAVPVRSSGDADGGPTPEPATARLDAGTASSSCGRRWS